MANVVPTSWRRYLNKPNTEIVYKDHLANHLYRVAGTKDANNYISYVKNTESGEVVDEDDTKFLIQAMVNLGLYDSTELLWAANSGMVQRVDGLLTYIRTGYDMTPDSLGAYSDNDLDGSAVEAQQPRLVGGIAPNSKPAAANLNGEERYFTHPEISFGAGDAWSLTVVFDWYGSNEAYVEILGGNNQLDQHGFFIKHADQGLSYYNGESTFGVGKIDEYINKQICLTITANGSIYTYYINGVSKYTGNNSLGAKASFIRLFNADNYLDRSHSGNISSYIIQSQALTATQVSDLYTTLRGLYPEIESVDIGTQTWGTDNLRMAATPMGNVIANVTVNADWANATVLYDAAYAAEADPAQKEYEGLKAAAMWCYYDNDVDVGATYGKLYNWYAAKLLDWDMDLAGFGWRVPTDAQFKTMEIALGMTQEEADGTDWRGTDEGGKMKMTGTDYWNSPNTGATNESGFTALGAGHRTTNGSFNYRGSYGLWWSSSGTSPSNAQRRTLYSSQAGVYRGSTNKALGFSVRLIKE